MTCIVLIADRSRMYMGADMQGTDSSFYADYQDKIFKREGLLFGISGSYSINNALKYRVKIPKLPKQYLTPQEIREYVHGKLYKQIKDLFTEEELLTSEDGEFKIASQVLIGIRGMIFVIQEDFAILEPRTPYYAIGSGSPYSFATLMCMDRHNIKLHAETKVREAISIAGGHCPDVSNDIMVIISSNEPE